MMATAIQAPLRLGELLFEASRARDGGSTPQPVAPPPLWPGAVERQEADSPNQGEPPYLHDPRPDLGQDSALWQALLRAALNRDGEAPDGVFARLHAVRCCGARLSRNGGGQFRIQPDGDYLDGAKGWQADRSTILAPAQQTVAALLREMAR